MNSARRVMLIAAATVTLGAAGYAMLRSSVPAMELPVVPLRTGLGPVSLLSEPPDSPYEALMEKAAQTAPGKAPLPGRSLKIGLRADF